MGDWADDGRDDVMDSQWRDYRDERELRIKAAQHANNAGVLSSEGFSVLAKHSEEQAAIRDQTEAELRDDRCWACTRRAGTPEGGRVPVCKRHYVKLRLKYPCRLLTPVPPPSQRTGATND